MYLHPASRRQRRGRFKTARTLSARRSREAAGPAVACGSPPVGQAPAPLNRVGTDVWQAFFYLKVLPCLRLRIRCRRGVGEASPQKTLPFLVLVGSRLRSEAGVSVIAGRGHPVSRPPHAKSGAAKPPTGGVKGYCCSAGDSISGECRTHPDKRLHMRNSAFCISAKEITISAGRWGFKCNAGLTLPGRFTPPDDGLDSGPSLLPLRLNALLEPTDKRHEIVNSR